jgi:MFS superfamily sulfate permease-like transporter
MKNEKKNIEIDLSNVKKNGNVLVALSNELSFVEAKELQNLLKGLPNEVKSLKFVISSVEEFDLTVYQVMYAWVRKAVQQNIKVEFKNETSTEPILLLQRSGFDFNKMID